RTSRRSASTSSIFAPIRFLCAGMIHSCSSPVACTDSSGDAAPISRWYVLVRSGSLTRPRPLVAFDCGSQSMRSVFTSAAANDEARLMAVVVLPTPPFWLATAITRPILYFVREIGEHFQNRSNRLVIATTYFSAAYLRTYAVHGVLGRDLKTFSTDVPAGTQVRFSMRIGFAKCSVRNTCGKLL